MLGDDDSSLTPNLCATGTRQPTLCFFLCVSCACRGIPQAADGFGLFVCRGKYMRSGLSAFEQLIEPNCPLLTIKSVFWQIGHQVFQNKCDDYFDSWSSSFITLIQMFIGEVRRHVLVRIAAARADKCVHVRGGIVSCIRVYGPPSEWHFSISSYTFSWSQLCSPRSS